MEEKLRRLEIKKLIQEYNFLLTDDEYKQEVISENKTEFLTKVEKLKSELGITNEINPPQENVDLPKKPKIDSNLINKTTKNKIKKLYREIAKKTHPDKTNSEKLIDLYMRATIASEDYNLFEIFIICNELNIDIDIDLEDKDTLLALIKMKKNEIKSVESSFIWIYINSNTEEEKNNLIKLFVEKHGKKN